MEGAPGLASSAPLRCLPYRTPAQACMHLRERYHPSPAQRLAAVVFFLFHCFFSPPLLVRPPLLHHAAAHPTTPSSPAGGIFAQLPESTTLAVDCVFQIQPSSAAQACPWPRAPRARAVHDQQGDEPDHRHSQIAYGVRGYQSRYSHSCFLFCSHTAFLLGFRWH